MPSTVATQLLAAGHRTCDTRVAMPAFRSWLGSQEVTSHDEQVSLHVGQSPKLVIMLQSDPLHTS